jgi:hypothetical protein
LWWWKLCLFCCISYLEGNEKYHSSSFPELTLWAHCYSLTTSLIIPRYLGLMIFAKKILTHVNLGYFFFHPIIVKPS